LVIFSVFNVVVIRVMKTN